MKVRLIDIFWLFVKVGCSIFGGGIVILPILEREAVKKRGWITSDELVEYYSISQLIPGINAPDVSMFIGYKLRGKSGAIAAGFGVIFVPTVLIICLASVLGLISNLGVVKSALWGISVGTIIIVISAIRTMWGRSIVDRFTGGFFVFVFVITAFTRISPVWLVLIALILGGIRGKMIEEVKD